jgi:hypothetical protein
MVTYFFLPFEDDMLQHFQGDFQSSRGICDADPFGDAGLFYEDFQPPLSFDLDGYQYVAIPEQSMTHTIEKKCFHLGSLQKDLQMKKQHVLDVGKSPS